MIHTIRVIYKNASEDLTGLGILEDAKKILKNLKQIKTAKIYRLEGVSLKEAKDLTEKLLYESINQNYSLDKKIFIQHLLKPPQKKGAGFIENNPHIIEIAYKPGVMNPEVASIIKSAKDLGIKLKAVDSSREYYFYGNISKNDVETLVEKLNLFNKTVEHIVKKNPQTLLIKGKIGKTSIINIREMKDKELMILSKDKLFLNLQEMKVIQNYFLNLKRDPTDCELETLAQTWSEHSGHKTFKAKILVDGIEKEPLIKRLKKEALKHDKNIVSAFNDNSGVMDFYDNYAISGKGETHNSPSAIEPYGGAMTGSGGVFRDIVGTGRGGKTLISTDIFCLANPNLPLSKLPPGCLPPTYLLKRVVKGVKDYGNRMGIPTNNGSFHFHDDFRAKPTVLVGAYGILSKKSAQIGVPKKGDLILSIGGRIGRDGIHGATFSSAEMTDRTITTNAQAVQIGNAIEEKRTFDAIIEARDKNLIRAIQDCGGGGLSSAIGELGQDLGVSIQLKNAKLKYQGLSPWEIWVSESQERMILAIQKTKLSLFKKICKKYNVEVSVLGKFDDDKKLKIFFGKQEVCNLDMKFLHHGLPQRIMTATHPNVILSKAKDLAFTRDSSASLRMTASEWIDILKKILSHGNVCSKEPIVRLYDHSVQGTNILQPFSGEKMDGPNDAAVIRPLLNKPYGMIVSHGLNPILNKIDPYWGSLWAGAEAISNYAAVGGDYKNASLINNYIWPFPDDISLWSLDKSVDAVVDFMKVLKIPVISGKDSLSSTYRGEHGQVIKIPPVLCISVFGKIPDVSKTVSADFKKVESIIILIGKMDFENMAGSVYYQACHPEQSEGSPIPHVDIKQLPKTLNAVYNAIQKNQILSCHDVSEGGLITTIFEMCVGGNMGADININVILSKAKNLHPDHVLFNETAGCFIVEIENELIAKKLFKNIPYLILGKTQKERIITVSNNKKKLFDVKLEDLKKSWQKPMRKIFSS